MSEDIVTRLRALNHPDAADAADEIERLRAAGDALATGVRSGQWDDALDAWTEARDGSATEYAGSALQDLRNYTETAIVEEARRG